MNLPRTKEEWIEFLKSSLGALSKFHLISLFVGAFLATVAQLMVGFWDFREGNQAIIRKQYDVAMTANARFQEQMLKYNAVFDGVPPPKGNDSYALEAQRYIGSLQDVTRLLPSTGKPLSTYIEALSLLNTYYSAANVPAKGTDEWMRFYGNFRVDFDRYIRARETYMNKLSSELGDYGRYVTNSG